MSVPLVASFPSPPANTIELGPLTIHYYGVLMALGVLAAAVITSRRYVRFGGDSQTVERVILWAVAVGFVGARLAYVVTHSARYADRWYAVLFIWEGGLAFYGGLTAGAIAAIVALRRSGGNVPAFADGVAIGIPVAQAIGRWGNYFNQELFGTPSSLPWALEIDPARRPDAYVDAATFHPTFLYESLWILALVVPLLLLAERKLDLRRGSLFLGYVALYGVGRFLMELLRTDTTFRLLGLSRNGWVSIAAVVGASVWLLARERRLSRPSQAQTPT